MENIREQLSCLVGDALSKASGIEDCDPQVTIAKYPDESDYQANGVMAAARRCGREPRELAEEVASIIRAENGLVASAEVAGPGFINIKLQDKFLIDRGNCVLLDPRSLIERVDQSLKIVIDYSSPNLAKEMHVGHLRGTVIGDCLARIFERLGHEVIRQNHVGDWGTQFGMLIAYMREVGENSSVLQAELEDLETFYRAAKDKFDSDPAFADRARSSVVKLQGGDPEYIEAWQRFIDESLRHCEAIYQRLDVQLTRADLDAESRYNNDLDGIISLLEQKGMLQDSNGAHCVFLPEFKRKDGEPLPLIVQKSDGGYLYSTTDLAAIQMRTRDFEADRALYVVDARQSLHFKQVFAVARAAGLASSRLSLEHIAYGTIMGWDGKPFKTRSGDAVKLADLLEEAVSRAFNIVSEKNPELAEDEKRRIAEAVGIASVKYADLSKNRITDYVFDWSRMLSFEGNTAPYLLYACTRMKSVLRKCPPQTNFPETGEISQLDRKLLLRALQLPEAIELVLRDCSPNILCNYLFELSLVFSQFYAYCPVLTANPDELRDSRIALVQLAKQALEQGLDLLGIQTLERM